LLVGGSIPNVLKTINFGAGSNVANNFNALLAVQPNSPVFVTEYWDGWFDHWVSFFSLTYLFNKFSGRTTSYSER
jgi:hypothetical protein